MPCAPSPEAAHWFELSLVLTAADAERLGECLLDAGASCVQAEDALANTEEEVAIFAEPGQEAEHPRVWPQTRVTALFGSHPDQASQAAASLLKEACEAAQLPLSSHWQLRALENQDWVRLTQAQFQPIEIGNRLVISPSWEPLRESHAQRKRLVLDPGLAFGTGSHPTTALCLRWLDAHIRGGERVIDYGCGSGILAIAAGLLGATSIDAIDIDPQALIATSENAKRNQVPINTFLTRGDTLAPADIVLANILAAPLKLLAPTLEALVKPGGFLVLAGLLNRQIEELAGFYPRVRLQAWQELEGWSVLVGQR
ncbi:MAG: 50S ribosomal protein L11 methyltransferase [Betaproteobacteria bacterium]|nr:50S ribosomal protein L11 methyltransferase [Betaproteobacteria bacterium]